jgi:ABC-2 type transport system ATP-binding protein
MTVLPIQIESLSHRYGERAALSDVSFEVRPGEIFGLLGPNGGGKTTLFRILNTTMHPTAGRVSVCGRDVATEPDAVRRVIGVVFQHASLDGKLTVLENLRHQGHLYGLSGGALRDRIGALLERFGVADRAHDRVEKLSGGLARRVDLLKGLLHRPRVLLLDEPSTGLDPQARWNLWQYLDLCRREDELTVLMTTHFMDEADRCDRVGIIDRGRLVAVGTPESLKHGIAGECLHIETADPQDLARRIVERFSVPVSVVDHTVRIERERAHEFVPQVVEAFAESIRSVSLSKPTLEEVFIQRTGRRFEDEEVASGRRTMAG